MEKLLRSVSREEMIGEDPELVIALEAALKVVAGQIANKESRGRKGEVGEALVDRSMVRSKKFQVTGYTADGGMILAEV